MKALKLAGLIFLVIWMAFTSWRLEYAIKISLGACDLAYEIAGQQHPEICNRKGPCPDIIQEPPYLNQKKP